LDQVDEEAQGDQHAADLDHEHGRVAELHPRVELAEGRHHGRPDDLRLEQLASAVSAHGTAQRRRGRRLSDRRSSRLHRLVAFRCHQKSFPVVVKSCSTSGPRASTGKKVSAPTISTTPVSRPTNRGLSVGKVPGPARECHRNENQR